MAKAVQNNLNPYLSIDQLSKKILGLPKDSIHFLHPSPHPPSSILIFYPFVFFSFQQTALIWFALDLLLLFVFLKESWESEKLHPLSKKWTFILYLTIITSNIFYISSSLGQINLLLLYLFFRFYLSWKKNNIFAGIFLGIIFGLKLMGWPFIIFLALKRKFKIIVVSGISFLVANIISAFLISWQTFLDYYLKEILQVGKRYASYHKNVSLFSL